MVSIYQEIQQLVKIEGDKFGKEWESVANKFKNRLTTKQDESFLRVAYEKYNNLINISKNKADKIPANENNMTLKSTLSKFCEAEQNVASTMYVMLRETDRKYFEDNLTSLENQFKKRDNYGAQLVTQYKIFIGEIPKSAPKPTVEKEKPKPDVVDDKDIFGELKVENEIIHLTEDFTSTGFMNRAKSALKRKMKSIDGNAINFYVNNPQYKNDQKSNFIFSDAYGSLYFYKQDMEAYKIDKIGSAFSFYHINDYDTKNQKRSILYSNSKNRKLTLKLSEGLKNKNVFYGIALKSSSKNNQNEDEGGRLKKNTDYTDFIAYGLLISNTAYNIVKYGGSNFDWENNDNQKIIAKGKLQKQDPDNIHTISIDKKDGKWDFYVDGSLIHTLTDNTHLHVIEELGHIVVTGQSLIHLREYEFIGTKN